MTYIIKSSVQGIINSSSQVTTNSSVQNTSGSANSHIAINGSVIDFTPDASATYVIYEIGFYAEVVATTSFQSLKFEYSSDGGSSWSEFNQNLGKNFGPPVTSTYRNFMNLKYVVDAWSGERKLRVTSGSFGGGHVTSLHRLSNWDGAGSISDKFCNTSVYVYAV